MQASLDQILNILTKIQSSISSLQSDMDTVKKNVSILLSDKPTAECTQPEETSEVLALVRSLDESLISISDEIVTVEVEVLAPEEIKSLECLPEDEVVTVDVEVVHESKAPQMFVIEVRAPKVNVTPAVRSKESQEGFEKAKQMAKEKARLEREQLKAKEAIKEEQTKAQESQVKLDKGRKYIESRSNIAKGNFSGKCKKIKDMNLEGYETLSKAEKSSFSRAMLKEAKEILGDKFNQSTKKVGGTYTFPIEMVELFQVKLDWRLIK